MQFPLTFLVSISQLVTSFCSPAQSPKWSWLWMIEPVVFFSLQRQLPFSSRWDDNDIAVELPIYSSSPGWTPLSRTAPGPTGRTLQETNQNMNVRFPPWITLWRCLDSKCGRIHKVNETPLCLSATTPDWVFSQPGASPAMDGGSLVMEMCCLDTHHLGFSLWLQGKTFFFCLTSAMTKEQQILNQWKG